jgi:esterase/lipase superfamily enzyme
VAAGHSQAPDESSLPEPCRKPAAEKLDTLEQRKEQLERLIARAREKLGKAAEEERTGRTRRLGKTQIELLEVLFKIECAKARLEIAKAEVPMDGVGAVAPPSPKPAPLKAAPKTAPGPPSLAAPQSAPKAEGAPAPAPPPGAGEKTTFAPTRSTSKMKTSAVTAGSARDAVEVTAYFATNRGRTAETDPRKAYDANVSKLTYGRAVVSIPSTHTPGSLELPSIWRLELRADPKRHFVLKDAVPLEGDEARAEMTKRLQEAKSKSLLVFVHGYNISFAETAMRTAQLAYDLSFPGIPFFFSWPSAGLYTGYLRDAETAQLSEDAFDEVLDDLSRLPVTDIYIIAHSMGSRVVSQVLKSRVDKGKTTGKISDLLLAAPDINADLFRTVIAPRLKALQGMQTTVYASSSDLALLASKAVHGYARVGDTASGVFVFPGLDTVDASRATMKVRAFGHSYLTDSAAVLRDIASIVRQRLSAKQRGLAPLGASPNIYWSLPDKR